LGATTRRQFIQRGGVLAGALALALGGAAGLARPGGTGGTAQAAGLTEARRRTYTALIAAVAVQPSVRLSPAVALDAADAFAAVYDAWPDERRRQADAVLDALERAPAGGFSALDDRRRGDDLRERSRVSHSRPAGAEHERLELVRQSLELAAVALGPEDGGHQIVTV
jgi:hypothetical protein